MKRYKTLSIALARAGITRDEMCQIARIPQSSFYWQIKNKRLSQKNIQKIAKALHMTDEEIGKLVKGT